MTTNDSDIAPVTCPGCASIDWTQDGFAVWADRSRIELGRYGRGTGRDETWRCRSCGYALPLDEPLAKALSQLRLAHWD